MQKIQSSCPSSMITDVFHRTFTSSPQKLDSVWESLNKRETFVKGQVFPFRVEFDNVSQEGAFQTGELNIHHGPLLSLHGAIGDVSADYRDLKYFYGSYVFSFRWIRPTRLEFFRRENSIELKIHSYLKPWARPLWRAGNALFWKFFGITFLF